MQKRQFGGSEFLKGLEVFPVELHLQIGRDFMPFIALLCMGYDFVAECGLKKSNLNYFHQNFFHFSTDKIKK